MAANTIELAKIVHERIAPMIAEYGLDLPAFMIENISLPAEVEAALDKRTATGVAGDLSSYTEFTAAEALTTSAANPGGGGGMAAGLGMGAGMAMAERMARSGPWGAAPAAPDPARRRPPPGGKRWHVATTGRRPAPTPATSSGGWSPTARVTGDSWLWTPGGPDWQRGRDVSELADLFSAPPPPPAA